MNAQIGDLISVWESRARKAHPADAMLINKQMRELREAIKSGAEDPVDGGAAYPLSPDLNWLKDARYTGMSLRDAMAIAALPAVIRCCAADNRPANETQDQMFARKAFSIADAMLAARKVQS